MDIRANIPDYRITRWCIRGIVSHSPFATGPICEIPTSVDDPPITGSAVEHTVGQSWEDLANSAEALYPPEKALTFRNIGDDAGVNY